MRDGRWPADEPVRSGRGSVRRTAATLSATPLRLALALLLLSGLIAVPAQPAAAQEDTEARVELTRLSPTIVDPDSEIVFEGRVTNVGDRPLVRLQASIWRSLTPLTTRDQFDQAAGSEPTDPEGERMYSAETPDAYQDLYTEEEPELPPGATATFRLRADAADFFAPAIAQNAVYLAGVHIRENGIATVGRTRTYLPVRAGEESGLQPGQTAIGTSTLVRLSAPPSMTRPRVFADDDLAGQVAPGGRLDALLRAAELPDSSYVVDPNLIAELRAMESGYQVIGPDGKLTAGEGREDAQAWLDRFAALRAEHDGFQSLYADPDLTALVRAGRLDLVEAGQQAAEAVPETKGLPLLVTPGDGAADRPTLQAARELGADAVLLADTSVGDAGPLLRASGGPTILSYDTEVAAGGPGPEPSDTSVQLRQTSLADSFLDSISGQPAGTLGRLRLVTDADQADGVSGSTAPWLKPRGVADLLTDDPEPLRNRLSYPDQAAENELTERQLTRLGRVEENLRTYRDLLAEPGRTDNLIDQLLIRGSSTAWRGHRGAMNDFLDAGQLLLSTGDGQSVSVNDLDDGTALRVEGNEQVTLTGSTGQIPVTVVNELTVPVRLQLITESPNRSRLQLDDIPAEQLGVIAAGAKAPAQIPARAGSNGTLPVTIRLATEDGDPIGEPLTIRVNATQAGRIGWIIAIASGIVLLGGVVLRIRQVARERGSGASDGSAESRESGESGESGEAAPDEVRSNSGAPATPTTPDARVAEPSHVLSDDQGVSEEQEDTVIRPRRSIDPGGLPRG